MKRNHLDWLIWLAAAVIVLLALGGLLREALTGDAAEPPEPVETFPELKLQLPAPVITLAPEDGNTPALDPNLNCCELDDSTDWEPFNYCEDVPLSESLQCILWDACQEYGVPYTVAIGLVETESDFKTDADNGKCYGLCQLNRDYFPDNLPAGEQLCTAMQFLGGLIEKHNGDMGAALCSYNAGHDTGSRNYSNLVLKRAEAWEQVLRT